MTGTEYQKAALRTANTENQTQNSLLINGVLGLCGESGEVADLVKKARFQGHNLDVDHLSEELGDVAWYLAVTASAIGKIWMIFWPPMSISCGRDTRRALTVREASTGLSMREESEHEDH